MLRLEDISVSLGGFHLALDLELAPGARLALIGPSGCGKSTLLNLIAGFLLPDTGRILIDGEDITTRPVPERPLSILFQEANLFPHLSAFDNVALGLNPSLRLGEAERVRVDEALSQVGLPGHGTRMPADLSGGQRSRLALARLLLRDKPLALLDEPFSALDPGLRREMLALMGELCQARNLSLVMVTHDLREAEGLCSDLCLMQDGAVQLHGGLQQMLANPPEALTAWL